MNESILDSVKKAIEGIRPEYTQFDPELVLHINTVFSVLTQIGVGPEEGFHITGSDETWEDYLGADDLTSLEMVKDYVVMRVGVMFDQTKTGAVIESANKIAAELEWRLNVAVD